MHTYQHTCIQTHIDAYILTRMHAYQHRHKGMVPCGYMTSQTVLAHKHSCIITCIFRKVSACACVILVCPVFLRCLLAWHMVTQCGRLLSSGTTCSPAGKELLAHEHLLTHMFPSGTAHAHTRRHTHTRRCKHRACQQRMASCMLPGWVWGCIHARRWSLCAVCPAGDRLCAFCRP